MKKLIYIFVFVFFFTDFYSVKSFSNEYEVSKMNLQNLYFKTDFSKIEERELFAEKCLDFWENFFWKKALESCKIEVLYFNNFKNKKLLDYISSIEKKFYEENIWKTFEIQFWGDIMLSRAVWAKNKTDWYDRIFKKFHPNKNISKDALLFYNLESPFTSLTDWDQNKPSFIFKSNLKNIEVLKELKQENQMLLSLANNHITNALGEGIDTTIKTLKENNIYYWWIWNKVVEIEINNKTKVCFWVYSYDWWKKYLRNKEKKVQVYVENKIDKKQILSDIKKMEEKKCNFKIISLHWWAEYSFNPSKNQVKLAHTIIDSWVDLILWHHSHILWKTEKYKWKMIYYSLWNFIFDQDWWKTFKSPYMSTIYDYKLKRKTIPTYIWNTFYNKYFIKNNWEIELLKTKNIKHRISFWELEKY